ncbi:unnamed protein product, partial [Didymodactylos carnosus]
YLQKEKSLEDIEPQVAGGSATALRLQNVLGDSEYYAKSEEMDYQMKQNQQPRDLEWSVESGSENQTRY